MNEANAYGGALRGDCPWYVERREDALVLNRLTEGKGCYVLTSHQMGKSSLVVRLLDNFRDHGLAAAIDLAAIGRELDAAQWYNALSLKIARQLHREDEIDAFWAARRDLPPFERFGQTLDCLSRRARPGRLILLIDEADLLRSLPFSPDEFLQTIHDAVFRRERGDPSDHPTTAYCLFATVPPSALWREGRLSARELGEVLLLRDFEREELFDVVDGVARCVLHRNELPVRTFLADMKFALEAVLERIFHWTHGQPYLTQKLGCAATQFLSREISHLDDITSEQCRQLVDGLCEGFFTNPSAPDEDCHLLWVRRNVLSCGLEPSRVAEILERIRQGNYSTFVDEGDGERLIQSGVVCIREGRLELRNRIYARVFGGPWLWAGLPGDLPASFRICGSTPPPRTMETASSRTELPNLRSLFFESNVATEPLVL